MNKIISIILTILQIIFGIPIIFLAGGAKRKTSHWFSYLQSGEQLLVISFIIVIGSIIFFVQQYRLDKIKPLDDWKFYVFLVFLLVVLIWWARLFFGF